MSGINPIVEKMYEELGESADIAIKILQGFESNRVASTLNPLPAGYCLEPGGSLSFGKGRGLGAPRDIDGVFETVDYIFQTALKHGDVSWAIDSSEGRRIPFVRFGNEQSMQDGHIIFRVVYGQPGAFGRGPEMNPSASQRGPALRSIIQDPDIADSEIYVLSQRKDYHIEITSCARTAHESDQIRSWVEKTISNNMWYFKHSGIIDFKFSQRLADNYRQIEGSNVHARPLKYFVAIEELSWYRYQMLKELCLTLHLTS